MIRNWVIDPPGRARRGVSAMVSNAVSILLLVPAMCADLWAKLRF